jgi:signal transduction histidine kinase
VVEGLTRHDIRNKLAALNGTVFLLKKRLVNNGDAVSHLDTLELLSQQILRLLEFERIYVQVGAEELTSVSVEQSLAEAALLFSDLKGAELVNDCRGLMVQADSLLRQLFFNLIDNSLRYGEKVSKIKVRLEEEENLLNLIYEDNGVGLSEETRSNLFKEGFGKNTGYGLYLIKRICEAYGWTIQETGKQGKGAQFTMTIPKTGNNGKSNYHFG